MSDRSFPRLAHGRAVEELGLVLRLLDHQVVGPDDEMLGKVEDLVLERRDGGEVVVVGLALGTAGWAGRQPGLLGVWVHAVWRRLDREEHPRPTTLSLAHVLHLDSAVIVDEVASRHVQASSDLERWLRDHLIAPIPGSRVDGDDTADSEGGPSGPEEGLRTAPLDEGARRPLSKLLGSDVVDADGARLGRVTEVHASPRQPPGQSDELVLVSLTHGDDMVGGGLGYDDDAHTGPAGLSHLIRWWHRHEHVTPWSDIVDLGDGHDPVRVQPRAARRGRRPD